MKLRLQIFSAIFFMCSSGMLFAEQKKISGQDYKEIRADILATITSINEIRLIMINSELKGGGTNKGDGKTVTRLTTNVAENNKTLKKIFEETKSNDIRLSILENAKFSNTESDFDEYVTKTAKKVFDVKLVQNRRDSIECDPKSDTYIYQRTANSNGMDIIETVTRHDISGKVCYERDNLKRKTQTELLFISNQSKVYNDYSVNDIAIYTDPVKLLTSTMAKGKAFGSGGIITFKSNGTSNTLVFNKISTVLDDDAELTLAVNQAEKTYLNCLIIGTRSNSTVSTEWYCPGDGLVKRVIFYPGAQNKASRSEIITLSYIEPY